MLGHAKLTFASRERTLPPDFYSFSGSAWQSGYA